MDDGWCCELGIRVNPVTATVQRGHGDSVKKLYRNAAVALPFAIPEDFVLGKDQTMGVYGL